MQPTIKLYDADAYATEFEATVLACQKREGEGQSGYDVVLDKTLFFPEEGGQTPDRGELDEVPVRDVQIKDEIIFHSVKDALEIGTKVKGKIEWEHRFSNMQQHTGEHIFSGLVHERFGYENVGFHLSDQIVTMDFNGMITDEEVAELELAANQVIADNVSVYALYPPYEELAAMEYRSKKELSGPIRIVTVEGVDICACCAPHVKRTGEVGQFKIMSRQNYKGGVRISFLCGFRALEDFRMKSGIVSDMVSLLSAKPENIVSTVEKMLSQIQDMKLELSKAKQEVLAYKLEDIPAEQEDVILFDASMDAQVVRLTVNRLMEKHIGVCGIFTGDDKEGYRFILGSTQKNCQEILTKMKEKIEVRGGGSPQMVQGSVQAEEQQIRELLGI